MSFVMLGRESFCRLLGIEVEKLNSLRRRGQVPMVPNLDLPEEIANERGYSAHSALVLALALKFADQFEVSRDRAAELAKLALVALDKRWAEISQTSLEIIQGRSPPHILFAAVEDSVPEDRRKAKVVPFCGTSAEIAAAHPQAVSVIAISASQCAARMRERARRHKIDLSGFWAA
jgi:hypothetical protein